MYNEWFSPPENYQDPNEEIIWKRPKYDPWMDEPAPPVDMETYLRGRQPSDDPYSEIRSPRTLSETANYNIPYPQSVQDMIVPPQSVEQAMGMYDPGGGLGAGAAGGMVKWAGKEFPNAYVFRGMGNPTAEVEALRELIGKSQKIVTPIEEAGSLISPKFVKRARPEGVVYDADTARGDIGNIGISDTYSSYSPEGKMFRTENIDRALGRVKNRLQGEGIWTQGPVTRTPGGGESFTEFPTEKAHRYNYAKDKLLEMQQGIKESDTFQDARRSHLMRDPNETSLEDFFEMQGSKYATQSNPAHAYSELTHRLGPGFENRMVGVNIDPTNPNPALLQLAKDRGLKVFGLPYSAENKPLNKDLLGLSDDVTWSLASMFHQKRPDRAHNMSVDSWHNWLQDLAHNKGDSPIGQDLLDLIREKGFATKLSDSREPWKSMMTSENPTGGEWVSKGIQTTEHATENEAKRTQYIKDAIKYYQKTLADDLPDDENEAFEYLYSLAHNKATEVFPYEKSVTKNYLTSSELPGNINYKYSGGAFPSE